ncbi:MAG: cation:proton antiporter [Candidatus Altiarchaeota archaeon]|nr:cation:proton antiporter [Candidatus Altiarchaeota archaeon]
MNGFLIVFTLFLTVSFLISEVFYKLRYPRVIGLILAGILLGFFSGLIFPEGSFMSALEKENPIALVIKGLGDVGAIFLLLIVGLEIDLNKLKTVSRDVFAIGIFASLTPFIAGFLLMRLIFQVTMTVSFIVAACLAISAEATTSMMLLEEGKLKSRVGGIMLGAGAIDDVLAVIFLSAIIVLTHGVDPSNIGAFAVHIVPSLQVLNESSNGLFLLLLLPAEFFIFLILCRLLFNIVPQVVEYSKQERSEIAEFMTVVIIGLSIAIISQFFGLETILGALIAGIIMQTSVKDTKEEERIINTLKIVSLSLIVPFFFISIGLYFDPTSLFRTYALILSVLVISILGKLVGSLVSKPFTDLSYRQLYLIGWGLNSRGAIEIVIASVALPLLIEEMGVKYATDIFSVIITMAIVTTFIFPFFMRREIGKYPKIMD